MKCLFLRVWKPTFLPDLDGARGLYSLPIFVPLSRHVLHRELANKHRVLILLDVQVLWALQDHQVTLCKEKTHKGMWRVEMSSSSRYQSKTQAKGTI